MSKGLLLSVAMLLSTLILVIVSCIVDVDGVCGGERDVVESERS